MMKKFALALVALLGLSTPAAADTMFVDYALGGTVTLVGVGPIAVVAGGGTVQYQATGGTNSLSNGTIIHGSARVEGFALAGPFFFTVFGDTFTGMAAGGFGAGGVGTLTSAGALVLPIFGGVGAVFGGTGTLHCFGGTCTGLGVPGSITVPVTLPLIGLLTDPAATALGPPSATLTFTGLALGTFGGLPLTASLTLSETGVRHYAPEPNTALLLGLGLTALAGVRGARRRVKH